MDVVTLGAALNGSKKYTDQVAQSLMGGVHYRGSVSYYDDLPANPAEGDSYTVKYAGSSGSVEDGTEYTWGYDTDTSSYAWISFSKDAYSKAETDALLSGKQAALSQAQLNAVNSGIDSEKVEQIETNKNNILSEQAKTIGMGTGGSNYLQVNGIKMYFDTTAPTGASVGDLWAGG